MLNINFLKKKKKTELVIYNTDRISKYINYFIYKFSDTKLRIKNV